MPKLNGAVTFPLAMMFEPAPWADNEKVPVNLAGLRLTGPRTEMSAPAPVLTICSAPPPLVVKLSSAAWVIARPGPAAPMVIGCVELVGVPRKIPLLPATVWLPVKTMLSAPY